MVPFSKDQQRSFVGKICSMANQWDWQPVFGESIGVAEPEATSDSPTLYSRTPEEAVLYSTCVVLNSGAYP